MRKSKQKPQSGMSWRLFIMGPGRQDAIERRIRWLREDELRKAREELEEQTKRPERVTPSRVERTRQLESSDRAEERNREDTERSARKTNVDLYEDDSVIGNLIHSPFFSAKDRSEAAKEKKQRESVKKTNMTDEEYKKSIDLQLATGDDENFWNREARLFRERWSDHENDWWLAKPINWVVKTGGAILAQGFDQIGNAQRRSDAEKRDRERKAYLGQFTQEAYEQAKRRNHLNSTANLFENGGYTYDGFMANLDQQQRETIAKRENEYRLLIAPSNETMDFYAQRLDEANQQIDAANSQVSPDKPDGYFLKFTRDRYGRISGLTSPWLNDFWTQAMENMNEVQRDEFAGLQLRFQEKANRIDAASKYYSAVQDADRIPRWNTLLNKFSQNPNQLNDFERATMEEIMQLPYDEIDRMSVSNKRNELQKRLELASVDQVRFKRDAEFVESYDPSNNFVSNLSTGVQQWLSKGFEDWWNYGWTSGLADDVEALDKNLKGIKTASLDRKQQMLLQYKDEGVRKSQYWLQGIEENEKDLQRWKDKHHVSDYFKFKMEHADGSFWKPDTWLYKNANLWGSSQASWIKQNISLLLNTALAFGTGGGSLAARGAIGATSAGLGYSSSSDETNAEVAQNYIERLKSVLKNKKAVDKFLKNAPENVKDNLDDAVTEYTLRPWELGDRLAQSAVFESLHGANSLYEDGIMAVFGNEMVEMYLQASPFARYARASKPSTIIGAANRAGAHAGPLGPAAQGVAWAGTAAAKATKDALSKTAVGRALSELTKHFVTFAKKVPERLLGEKRYKAALEKAGKLSTNTFGANSVPHRVLSANNYVRYQAIKDYAKDVAGQTFRASINEGIEEGKQYLLGQKFIRGDYDNDLHKSILDAGRFYNDLEAGIQSAIAMSTLLPFMPALVEDAELIENIKGGMLGGMFQTGMQRSIFGVVPTVQLMKMQDFIANEITLEKQALMDDYQKAKTYAKYAQDDAAIGRMMLAFDRYADANQNEVDRGVDGASQDMVDLIKAQKKLAESVINIARDSNIRSRAKALGIQPDSDKFYQYVGAVNMFQESKKEAKERNEDAINNVNQILLNTNSPFIVDEVTGEVTAETQLNTGVRLQRAIKPVVGEDGKPLSGQSLLEAAATNWRKNLHVFARISQLLSLKEYLEEAVSNDDLSNLAKKDLKFQLNRVKRMLRADLLNIKDEERDNIEKNAADYLRGLENSEEILKAVHQEITSQIDVDYHDAMLKGLLGDLIDVAGGTTDMLEDLVHSGYKHPESVIDDIEKTTESDYQIANNIEQDWLYQYDLLDDLSLDKFEEYRRKQRENSLKLEAAKIEQDVADTQLEETGEVIDEDELINQAGSYSVNPLTEQMLSDEELEETFDAPIVDVLQDNNVPIDIKRPSPSEMRAVRKKALVAAKQRRAGRLANVTTVSPPEEKRKSYQSPSTVLKTTPQHVLDVFAELEDLLQQIANISEVDLIDVRDETKWQAKLLEDRINEWMANTLTSQDFGSSNLAEAEMFRTDANTIFLTISEEIEWSHQHNINGTLIDFSDTKTLRRATYTNEDAERDLLKDEAKYEQDVRTTFSLLTEELYNIGREIKSGKHIQDNQLDSPTSTRIDEILATLDRLIDDAFEVGIVFSEKDIQEYTAAKKWFVNNEGLTGRKSDPVVVQKPAEVPVVTPTSTFVVSYIKSSEYGQGVDKSVAQDGTKLSDVINNPDFITNGIFKLVVTEHKQKASTVKKISVVVEYNGKMFSPVTLDSQMMQKTQQGKDFYMAVLKAYNTNAIPEGSVLVPGRVLRTNGVQHHGGKFETVLEKGLVSVSRQEGVINLYDVDFTPNQNTFGITTARLTSSNAYTTYIVTPGNSTTQPLHRFNGNKNFPGAVFMMLRRPYAECNPNDAPKVPVLLRAKKMSKGDAQLVVDILSGKYNPNSQKGRAALYEHVWVNGENTGITGLDLIKLFIPQTGAKDIYSNRLHFDIAAGSYELQITGRILGDPLSMTPITRTFNLSTTEGVLDFINFAVNNIEVSVDKEFMAQRFGYNNHAANFPFHRLLQAPAMIRRINSGELIRFGDSSITIDRSDIVNPNDENDQRGLSGLAWMMKNGFLETDFDGVDGVQLGVDAEQGVRIVPRDLLVTSATSEPEEQLSLAERETGYTTEELESFFDKAVKDVKAGKKIDEREVRKHLARILGERFANENVLVVDAIIDTAANGMVIGRCYHDSIVLSRFAEEGTEYHEAFHRILEIVAPSKLRAAVYKAYRSNKVGADTKTDAEIAELLADEFMYFVMNKPTFKFPHSIKEAFSMVKDYVNFVRQIGSFRLYLMYSFTNSGLINKLFTISKDRQDAFNKIHSGGMNKVIRNKEFDKVINSAMYRDLKNSLVYLIFSSKTIDIAGRNIQDLDISEEFVRKSKMYTEWMNDDSIPQDTKDALNQLLDNWELVKPDIAATISKFATDSKVTFEDENNDAINGDEESIAGAAIGDHTRSSYEFSQFSRATSRVKFFFSAIPNRVWTEDGGKRVPKMQLNKAGLPEFTNANILFNIILNKLHSCQTYQELLDGLQLLGYDDARIFHVYMRLKKLHDRVLSGLASAEEKGILTQIKTIVHSAKNEFMIAKSMKLGNMFTVLMESTDAEYNAAQYVRDWQQLLNGGANSYVTRDAEGKYAMKGSYKPSIFGKIADQIVKFSVDIQDPSIDYKAMKVRIINMFNSLGIQFDMGAFDHMLRFKYGSSDLVGMQKMFADPTFNILGLANQLRTLYDANGNIMQDTMSHIFERTGFVGELANWKYQYRHAHDQLTVLATNNNRYYVISENNHITDQTDHLNRKDDYFKDLCEFNYNLYEAGEAVQVGSKRTIGSVILKYLSSPGYNSPISVVTFAGFKTDEAGDVGQDYATITAKEDYIAKASMLLQGAMILPTLSDKKTWTFLTGIPMPGLKFDRIRTSTGMLMVCNLNIAQSGIISDEIVDQMWEYAMCERKAIQETLTAVRGGETANGTVAPLAEEKKVANYHKATVKVNGKEYEIVQGARFSSLLGVYANGKYIEFNRVLDENGKYLSEEDNLAIADQYFFSQPVDVQKNLIRELLGHRISEELAYVERLGLITKDENTGLYTNVGLDQMAIDAVTAAFVGNRAVSNLDTSAAIAAVVADVCCKSIISIHEAERVYSGHPATYAWRYDNAGHLIDRTVDLHKRLGGLVSTGQNNDLELDGIPTDYVCAEVDNEFTDADNYEGLHQLMVESEIRTGFLQYLNEKIKASFERENVAKDNAVLADSLTLEDIKKQVGENMYKLLEAKGEAKAKVFKRSADQDGVDIADGAAYISDKMAENLLRMVGAWTNEVERAFKILRGEPVDGRVYTTKDIRQLASAYELVWTNVIGNLKYTAYGFRKEGGALIPYYDKMALFPMFKCMCTGHMADMYELMKNLGVDMVMVNSAVKTGSMGSKEMTWQPDFKFNTYKLKYAYLRKQFNTDPKEAEYMKMGTQSAKIAMSALIPGREYQFNGATETATQMRDGIMQDQCALSKLGVKDVEDELFDVERDDDGKVTSKKLNVSKFSLLLTDELVSRGASTELLDAVSIENGKMKVPFAALSGLGWIQSIIASIVNKRIVDINLPGAAFIQRSVWGMEGPSVLTDDNIPSSLYGGKTLQMINENGSMDCVLSIDYFDNMIPKVPKKDKDGHIIYKVDDDGRFVLNKDGNRVPVMTRMPFEQARQWLLDNGVIGGQPTIFAYRIPTQAISSIHALRCVDVIPVVRDTVILPAEFTKITGSDFDIDKLFLSTYFWHNGEDGKMTTQYEKGTREYYANDLLHRYITLLTDLDENGKSRNTHMQHASIDGDTKLLKNIVKDLEEDIVKLPILPYKDYLLSEQVKTKEEFITGKFGIGPFALNNNSQILTTLYGVEFNIGDNIMTKLGLTSLHESKDRDGNSIMSWLSALINAHVDVAKDPYIMRLGVNKYTYNLTNLLVRTGLGKTTFYMLTLPIMKQLSAAYNTASGTYMRTPGITEALAQREAINKVLLDEFKKLGIEVTNPDIKRSTDKVNECVRLFKLYMQNTHKIDYMEAILLIFDRGDNTLHEISKHGDRYDGARVYTEGLNFTEVQLLVAVANLEFELYAQALSDLVKYSKIDTKKQGKNIQELREYMQGYYKMFNPASKSAMRTVFEPNGLTRMSQMSYIATKTHDAISEFFSILDGQLLEATPAFGREIDRILLKIDKEDSRGQELVNSITRRILIKIKSGYFFNTGGFCDAFGINPKSLVSGNNTICDRLNKLKNKILRDPAYSDLVDGSGEISNYLLRSLTESYTYSYNPSLNPAQGNRPDTYPTAKFIKLFNFTEDDTIDQDSIIEAWDELLNDGKHPDIQEFARDLIVYAFITSGDSGSMTDLFKYIPNSWRVDPMGMGYEASYAYYMENQLAKAKGSNNGILTEADIDDIILNSWYDDKIVTTVSSESVGNSITLAGQSNPSIIILTPGKSLPEFIKIRRKGASDKRSQRLYSLYKQVFINRRVVYVEVDPKGMKFPKGHYIYEMSRQDNQYADVIVSLLSDPNMKAFAQQYGLSTSSIETFLQDLVNLLERTPAEAKSALVLSNILPEEMLILSPLRVYTAPNTYPVPSNTLTITPIQPADKKATAKGKISNKFIGFANGIEGSSTAEYARQAGDKANVGEYSPNDVVFVSIPGKRGDEIVRNVQQNLTIEEALRALEAGATLVTDNASYVESSDYNEGEKMLAEQLTVAGATYSERTVDGQVLGMWLKVTTVVEDDPLSISSISNKTEAYGVEVSSGSLEFWNKVRNGWQASHPDGIIAYRRNGDNPLTFSPLAVNDGWIGNPFSTQTRGEDTVLKFYDWLITGNNFGEPRANEEFRQAIIRKILHTPGNAPILYYTELNRPSHATVIGYLVNNKNLLQGSTGVNVTPLLQASSRLNNAESVKYTMTEEFADLIKHHIANDEFTVPDYSSNRIRQSLIKLTDALFDYLKSNNVKIEFKRADKNNIAGGSSMIYSNEDGDGYVIEVDSSSNDVYLDILHELLHIATNPFDNDVVRNLGGQELPEQLLIYYKAFHAKATSEDGYADAYRALWDFKNRKITRLLFEERVPEKMRALLHACEGPGEFLSMFISSKHVLNITSSITLADKSLFDEFVRWFKDFISKLFKGYSYVDTANVIDDITLFLIDYKSSYLTPQQIYEPINGKSILSSGETIYTTNDILTQLIPSTTLQKYNDSKDLLKSIVEEFNSLNPIAKMQKTAYGSVDGVTKLIQHRKNRWVVLGVNQNKFYINNDEVNGVEYARYQMAKWLVENKLPANFIVITNGGLVAINYNYIASRPLQRGSVILSNETYSESLRPAITEFADRLGFELVEDKDKDTFVSFVNKVITISDFNDEEFNRIKASVAAKLMPKSSRSKLEQLATKLGKTDDLIEEDIFNALQNGDELIYESKSLLLKIKDFISDLIGKILNTQSYYEKLIKKAADEVLDVDSKWYTTVIEEGFSLKLLDVNKLKQSPMYHAYDVLTKNGAYLDGSAAVRMLGTLYRANEEDFHDLDFSKPYDNFSWAIKVELDQFLLNYKFATDDFTHLDKIVYNDLRKNMLENCNTIFKSSDLYKKLSPYYKELKVKYAIKTKKLGLLVTLELDGNSVDIFYAKNVTGYTISGIKVADFSNAFAAKLVMGRDKDIRDVINFHRFKDVQYYQNRSYRVYQGRKTPLIDGRSYNYWTLDENEARYYGSFIRSTTVNTDGFLNKYKTVKGKFDWSDEYVKLTHEFEKTLNPGEFFDILNNSTRGMEIQNEFWEFLENKGYHGFVAFPLSDEYLSLPLESRDNQYIVTFSGEKQLILDNLKSLGEELMKNCK